MKAVLETRFVGQAPDASGHPLAPPELVYQTQEPVTPRINWVGELLAIAVAFIAGSAFILSPLPNYALGTQAVNSAVKSAAIAG